jgi:hypothetical protein
MPELASKMLKNEEEKEESSKKEELKDLEELQDKQFTRFKKQIVEDATQELR